jgi:hypothetical protein
MSHVTRAFSRRWVRPRAVATCAHTTSRLGFDEPVIYALRMLLSVDGRSLTGSCHRLRAVGKARATAAARLDTSSRA